jgi:hypothetical protein
MEESLECFMWYESTTQALSDNSKTGDVVWDKVLGCKELTWKYIKCSRDEDVALDVW